MFDRLKDACINFIKGKGLFSNVLRSCQHTSQCNTQLCTGKSDNNLLLHSTKVATLPRFVYYTKNLFDIRCKSVTRSFVTKNPTKN